MEEIAIKKEVKSIQGIVLRKSGEMTVIVEVSTEERHKVYGKKIKRSKRYMVHDPANEAVVDDVVVIKQGRPMSKRKRWVLVKLENLKEKRKASTKDPKKASPTAGI